MGYAIGITGSKGFLSSMDEMEMLLPKSFNRYLDDPDTIHSPIDDITEGCPNWRDVDELHIKKNLFQLIEQFHAKIFCIATLYHYGDFKTSLHLNNGFIIQRWKLYQLMIYHFVNNG